MYIIIWWMMKFNNFFFAMHKFKYHFVDIVCIDILLWGSCRHVIGILKVVFWRHIVHSRRFASTFCWIRDAVSNPPVWQAQNISLGLYELLWKCLSRLSADFNGTEYWNSLSTNSLKLKSEPEFDRRCNEPC